MKKIFDCLVFIGDPHVRSEAVFRRLPNYPQDCLVKMDFIAQKCNELNAKPICLGDYFDKSNESNISYLSKNAKILKKFETTMTVIPGNHDASGTSACMEGDPLEFLDTCGVVEIKQDLAQEFVCIGDKLICLVYCQSGLDLPDEITPQRKCDFVFLITHHDLAIDSAYPGALPLKEIKGVDFVINGHMHATKQPKKIGQTWYFNPGNIQPLTIDLKDFKPHVWDWTPEKSALTPIEIPHDFNCFELTGLRVSPSKELHMPEDIEEELLPELIKPSNVLEDSKFAMDLSAVGELTKSADATELKQEIALTMELGDYSDDAKELMTYLLSNLDLQKKKK